MMLMENLLLIGKIKKRIYINRISGKLGMITVLDHLLINRLGQVMSSYSWGLQVS